jgi:hypothetical protein
VLLTDDAILHGTRGAPCATAYHALPVVLDPQLVRDSAREVAIVFLETAERSFLFRKLPAAPGPPAPIEFRTLVCRPAPTADVPVEVFAERGTSAPSR